MEKWYLWSPTSKSVVKEAMANQLLLPETASDILGDFCWHPLEWICFSRICEEYQGQPLKLLIKWWLDKLHALLQLGCPFGQPKVWYVAPCQLLASQQKHISRTRKNNSNVFVYDHDHELTNMLSLLVFFLANDQRLVSWLLPELPPGTRHAREFYWGDSKNTNWWFRAIWKLLVKLEIFPK